jgi:hypothetical protein
MTAASLGQEPCGAWAIRGTSAVVSDEFKIHGRTHNSTHIDILDAFSKGAGVCQGSEGQAFRDEILLIRRADGTLLYSVSASESGCLSMVIECPSGNSINGGNHWYSPVVTETVRVNDTRQIEVVLAALDGVNGKQPGTGKISAAGRGKLTDSF